MSIRIHKMVEDLYPRICAIARSQPDLERARPKIRALALEHRVPSVQLIAQYLGRRPVQYRVCGHCGETVRLHEFATTKCLDCVEADYVAAQA